jgi:uncharacterized protein YegL
VPANVRNLVNAFQSNFYDKYASYLRSSQPRPGSATGNVNGAGGGSNIALDLLFLIDTSGSISPAEFDLFRNFTLSLIPEFELDSQGTRVAIIAFSQYVYTVHPFSSDKRTLCTAISYFQHNSGPKTCIDKGLAYSKEEFKNYGRSQQSTRRSLILLTDGHYNCEGDLRNISDSLYEKNVEIFSFAIGEANHEILHSIATSPEDQHVFYASSFTLFADFAKALRPSKTFEYSKHFALLHHSCSFRTYRKSMWDRRSAWIRCPSLQWREIPPFVMALVGCSVHFRYWDRIQIFLRCYLAE